MLSESQGGCEYTGQLHSLAETTFYLLSYLELTSDLQPRQLGQTLLAHPLTVLEKESSELHQC